MGCKMMTAFDLKSPFRSCKSLAILCLLETALLVKGCRIRCSSHPILGLNIEHRTNDGVPKTALKGRLTIGPREDPRRSLELPLVRKWVALVRFLCRHTGTFYDDES